MGERSPILDPDARGVFFGLSGMHTKADMLRAVMEGVVYSQLDCLSVFNDLDINFGQITATGGGGRSPFWRQMMADVFGYPISTVTNKEGAALGVAILAGVGAGVYKDIPAACGSILQMNETQLPDDSKKDAYSSYSSVYREVYSNLKGTFKPLFGL